MKLPRSRDLPPPLVSYAKIFFFSLAGSISCSLAVGSCMPVLGVVLVLWILWGVTREFEEWQ